MEKPENVYICALKLLMHNAFLVLLVALVSCSKEEETSKTTPETSCRFLKVSLLSTGGGNVSYGTNSAIEYNAQGQMFRSIDQSKTTYIGGGEKNALATSVYEYNADGFVTSEKRSAIEDDSKRTENNSLTSQFKYQDGRLSEEISTTIFESYYKDTGQTETYTYNKNTKYEYESGGSMAKITELNNSSLGGNSASRYYYSNGRLSRITYQAGNGPEEDDFTIAEGKIVERKNGSDVTIYKYDSQDRLIRIEYWNAGQLTGFADQNYDNQKAPIETSPQLFLKGWPKQKTIRGEYGNTSNNIINFRQISIQGSANVELVSYTFQYEFNTKGIPVKAKLTGTLQGQPYNGEYTYEYIDCN
ncbi:MAG: hypothetical protein ABIN80_22655 [Dyadobacter sp.]|uniref:hypothetical protein n=1 Tax=Dyadobacter sp. TaxID=1914288 RepID=UPI003265668C